MENIRVLLVDDEAEFRQVIARRLNKRGIVPEQAGSGEESLTILGKTPADVVILDVKMPGMSGIEALHRIKEKYPKTEVILLTGHASRQDGIEGIKSGAFDYLSKPVEFEHLLRKIKQAYHKIRRMEEKHLEAEFRSKMEREMTATQRLAALGTLATGIAHEINNPLAIIKESAGWMRQLLKREKMADMPLKKDFEMALDKIEKGIERSRRITHQLLGFARKTDSVISEIDLSELVDEAVDLVHAEAVEKGVEIIRQIQPSIGPIWSDPNLLRQVLINLLTNAVQANNPGGKVIVSLESTDEGLSLIVEDTGTGIPKENLDKIFEPFFSTKSPGEGTGLGLFVTRGIIERLGGKIRVESRLGHGSRFCVSLPKYSHEKEAPQEKENRSDLIDQIAEYSRSADQSSEGEKVP